MKLSIVIYFLFIYSLVVNAEEQTKQNPIQEKPKDTITWKPSTTLQVYPQENDSILYLNGEKIDKTPMRIEGIKPGTYRMRIENLWTEAFEKDIEVKEGEMNEIKPTLTYRPIYKDYKKSKTMYNVLKIGTISSFSLSAVAFGASYYLKEKAYDDMVDSRFLLSQEAIDTALKSANDLVAYSNASKAASLGLLAVGSITGGFTIYEYFRVKKIKAEAKLSFVILEKAIYLTYNSY